MSTIRSIRNFNYSTATERWLYHYSRYAFNGVVPVRTLYTGNLIVTVRPTQGGILAPLIFQRPVWGPSASIYGIKLPNLNTIVNTFGVTPAQAANVACSIELVTRDPLDNSAFTFTEVTNLSISPGS